MNAPVRRTPEAARVDCPACQGHGTVPGVRSERFNPTGLSDCSHCEGAGNVTSSEAARIAARAS